MARVLKAGVYRQQQPIGPARGVRMPPSCPRANLERRCSGALTGSPLSAADAVPALQASHSARACSARPIRRHATGLCAPPRRAPPRPARIAVTMAAPTIPAHSEPEAAAAPPLNLNPTPGPGGKLNPTCSVSPTSREFSRLARQVSPTCRSAWVGLGG